MNFLKDFQTEVKILVGVLVIIVLIVGEFFLFFNNSQQQTEQIPQDVTLSEGETSEEISVVDDSGVIQFSGEALRGEIFEREINSNLVFRLVPRSQGWDIQVGNKVSPDLDFSRITLPLRGINSRQLNGWHFRNADNTGPNEGSVNAPQAVREFEFVVGQEDYDIAFDALTKLSWPYDYTDEEVDEASQQIYGGLKRGTGTLTVIDMELGNLEPNEQAWFEHIKFDIEITLPTDISNWQTYRNEEFRFELKYPNSWEVSGTYDYPPYTRISIRSPNDSAVVIAPVGWPAGSFEGVNVEKKEEKIGGQFVLIDSYLTEDDVEWQQFIRFSEYNEDWGEYNYILTRVNFLNLEKKCAVEITPDRPECGAGGGIKYFGEIDIHEKETIDQILSTFRFIESQSVLKPADSQTPVAGACVDPHGDIATVVLQRTPDNVPQPRCLLIRGDQNLQIENSTDETITVTLGRVQMTVEPGKTQSDNLPFDSYLAPGVHHILISPSYLLEYPSPVTRPVIWLQ